MLNYQGVRGLKPQFAQKKKAGWTVTIFESAARNLEDPPGPTLDTVPSKINHLSSIF